MTPLAPGFSEIEVAPHRCGLNRAEGAVCTPRGPVRVAWRQESGRFALSIQAPAGTPVRVRLPNGEQRAFEGGSFTTEIGLA